MTVLELMSSPVLAAKRDQVNFGVLGTFPEGPQSACSTAFKGGTLTEAIGAIEGKKIAALSGYHHENVDKICSELNRLITEELIFGGVSIHPSGFVPRLREILELGGLPVLGMSPGFVESKVDSLSWYWNFFPSWKSYAEEVVRVAKIEQKRRMILLESNEILKQSLIRASEGRLEILHSQPTRFLQGDFVWSSDLSPKDCERIRQVSVPLWVPLFEVKPGCPAAKVKYFTHFEIRNASQGACFAAGRELMGILVESLRRSKPGVPKEINRQIQIVAEERGIVFDSTRNPVRRIHVFDSVELQTVFDASK